jgi:PadR family transcriptional regulator PadR
MYLILILLPMDKDTLENLQNTQAQMRKGILEFCIMLIINRGESLYASDILKDLQSIDMIVVEGTVYPLLNRLKREGVLDYTWEESPNGPPRKYYRLTPKGKDVLKALIVSWKSLSQSISSLLKRHA